MLITQPCIIPNMDESAYHADPCPTPSASRSFLHALVTKSPLHAMLEHPRLNPHYVGVDKRQFDFGSAAHDYFLRGGDRVAVLDFADYKTNAAKAERDASFANGKLPILKSKFSAIESMTIAAREQIKYLQEGHNNAFQNGSPECGVFFQHNGQWCRTMPDWIENDGWLDDFKTTEVESPQQWMDGVFSQHGYALQAYMGLKGYHAVTGNNAKGFRFFVQEINEPFALYVVLVDSTLLEVAESEFSLGMDIFDRCMKTGSWPAHSTRPYIAYPSFKANRLFEDVKSQRTSMETVNGDLRKLQNDFWKPIEGIKQNG